MEKIWRKIFYGIAFLAVFALLAVFIREFDLSDRIFADLTSENTTTSAPVPALSELATVLESSELKLSEADATTSIEKIFENTSENNADIFQSQIVSTMEGSVDSAITQPAESTELSHENEAVSVPESSLKFVESTPKPLSISSVSDSGLSSLESVSTLTPSSVSTSVSESLTVFPFLPMEFSDSIATITPSISEPAIDSVPESIDSTSIPLNSTPTMPAVSDPFKSLEKYGETLEDANGSTERRQLTEVILAIDELRSRLDREAKNIEDTLQYVYSRHFLKSLESYCSESSYYTFDETGGECIFVNRKVCSREDLKEENRYFDLESCRQEAEVLKNMSPVERSQFNNQKREYLAKLLRLQEEFSYYSVKWKELLDQVHRAKNYNELGIAGNLVNEFRMNDGAGKQMTEAKKQKSDQLEQSEESQQFEKSEKPVKIEESEKSEKTDQSEKPEKSGKSEQPGKPKKSEKSEKMPEVQKKSIQESGKNLQNDKKDVDKAKKMSKSVKNS